MQAAALAVERGWSINIGGGMHHACAEGGGGWCMFSDLSLALRKVRKASQGAIDKIMIIDTDVHQVNVTGSHIYASILGACASCCLVMNWCMCLSQLRSHICIGITCLCHSCVHSECVPDRLSRPS